MDFMTTKEAVKKWNISERRIRKLLQQGRIDGAIKLGNSWSIPINAIKPIDKRSIKYEENKITINIDKDYFNKIDELKKQLRSQTIENSLILDWIYNDNSIEENSLTLEETKIVLSGITVGGKSIKEHLEIINYEKAIQYLYELVNNKETITENSIKYIHFLLLKDIDNAAAGKYRTENILDKPDYTIISSLMEKLLTNYNSWEIYHPIIRAVLLHGELIKISPFKEANQKISKLIMNLVLISNGYKPIIINKEDYIKYYEFLTKAITTGDYTDLIKLIVKLEEIIQL